MALMSDPKALLLLFSMPGIIVYADAAMVSRCRDFMILPLIKSASVLCQWVRPLLHAALAVTVCNQFSMGVDAMHTPRQPLANCEHLYVSGMSVCKLN